MERRTDQATGATILRGSIFEIEPSTPRRQPFGAVPFPADLKGEVRSEYANDGEPESTDEDEVAAPA